MFLQKHPVREVLFLNIGLEDAPSRYMDKDAGMFCLYEFNFFSSVYFFLLFVYVIKKMALIKYVFHYEI